MTLPPYNAKSAGEVVGELEVGATLEEAGRRAGVAPDALAAWTQGVPEFARRVEMAQTGDEAVAARTIREARSKDWRVALHLRDRSHAEEELNRLRALTTD